MKIIMQITKLFLAEGVDFDTEVAKREATRAARNPYSVCKLVQHACR